MKILRYKHNSDVSYALGATLTMELVKAMPEIVECVLISSHTEEKGGIAELLSMCSEKKIPCEKNDKAFNILSPKGNCYVIGVFKKYTKKISESSHIVLVNPSDAGNLGTILRTATGFGLTDIAIIKPAVDIFDPRTVRASMGALFHVNIEYFDCIEDYEKRFSKHNKYAFMLTSSTTIGTTKVQKPFSLIFGNEATGLPEVYAQKYKTVRIPHSKNIDSLNLPIAVSIASYEYTKEDWN